MGVEERGGEGRGDCLCLHLLMTVKGFFESKNTPCALECVKGETRLAMVEKGGVEKLSHLKPMERKTRSLSM